MRRQTQAVAARLEGELGSSGTIQLKGRFAIAGGALDLVNISPSLSKLLKRRKLVLKSERDDKGDFVCLYVKGGSPNELPVGFVRPISSGMLWTAHARIRPAHIYPYDRVSGATNFEAGIRAVLDRARYGDILAAHEKESGAVVTYYTAKMHEHHAVWLDMLDEPEGIDHLGNGTVRFTSIALAYMRSLPEHLACYLDDEDRIWISGTSYRLIRER
ncbi:MAG: hypothetical protein ACRDTA_21755 [Pseudonocardiaceae bacterium]